MMKFRKIWSLFLLLMLFLPGFSLGQEYSIQVKVINIRNLNGRVQLQLYRDKETFKKATPWKNFHISKENVKNGVLNYTISNLPPGTYGIAMLDDENNNDKMDYSFMMPKEGFGFADYYHSGWSKPTFEQFKFELNQDKNMTIKIRYVN